MAIKNSSVSTASAKPTVKKSGVDRIFLMIVLSLLAIGVVVLFSASYANAKHVHGDSYFYSLPHIKWVAFGLAAMILCSTVIDHQFIRKLRTVIFVVCLLSMALVYIPGLGLTVNHATRWIKIAGVQIQPSEFAKFAIILFFAEHVSSGWSRGKHIIKQLMPYGIVAAYILIVLVPQPHYSCAIIMLMILVIMAYFDGIPMKRLIIVCLILAAIVIPLLLMSGHGATRLKVWFHPENYLTRDSGGEGWQPYQSMIAIGSGGLWGVGFGQSTQKHMYLPEPHNDYIFAILCEEMGFFCAVVVIGLFLALVLRGIYIARRAPSVYAAMLVIGIVSQVAIQAFLNIGVVTNALPSTGISLPFFSYGGTSMLTLLAEMGIVLNISRYSYEPEKAD